MFAEIILHDYKAPLAKRLESRRYCGPYRWRPAKPGNGRGFYQHSRHLACGDSTFDLRLELANDHLSDHGYGSLSRIDGYYADNFQDCTLTPIVARLPHGRGFLAGWTMGTGMIARLAPDIHETIEDAARAAHSEAERDAERQREAEETEDDE